MKDIRHNECAEIEGGILLELALICWVYDPKLKITLDGTRYEVGC